MKSEIYLVTGTAGTGKTSVMRELSRQGWNTIGIDEEDGLTAWIHKETKEIVRPGVELTDSFLQTHDWGCNVVKLKQLLSQTSKPVIVCGSCDNIDEVMQECGESFVLVCEPEVFLPRIEQRTDNQYGKSEEAKRQLLGYYKSYREQCIVAGAKPVDATPALDLVVQQIIENIGE